MFTDKDSVIINEVSMGQYLTSVKFGKHKVWAEDTGRNMAYETVGSLGGIFDKLTLNFRKLNEEELGIVASILDSETQITKFTHTNGTTKTMDTYTGDWEVLFKRIKVGESFSCSVIARKPRQ